MTVPPLLDGTDLALLAVGAYVFADAVLAFTLGRCVLPGLRCRACRRRP